MYRYVWSPAGGWWNNPANWRLHTAAAMGVLVLTSYTCVQWEKNNSIRYNISDKTAIRPRGIHHTSIWDNDTRLPTGIQYSQLDSNTGRIKSNDSGDNNEGQDEE